MVGRFALKGLHATGGLGEVFLARDTELNREVAVKRIKSHYADDAGSRSRFLSEATLTARLDHPGVVPVFGLVNDVRGRPCYAMRFIRGETLKDEIDRFYGVPKSEDKGQKTDKTDGATGSTAPGPAPAPEEAAPEVPRSVAFRHLLSRFIATCQAIAYAHKKNIIHRDIKPANIMVGSFGETLVVDWGLAKSLDDGPDFDRITRAAAASGFRHDPDATDLPSHMTSAGTAVGTPAYMAPEQAAGDVHAVGPRADVYALGATLFVILTGKAPVGGKTTAEVLANVRSGAYEPAAAVNPKCPKPLDAVARKAMALRPEDRYAGALELAADVERWLSDEPVSCYRDPLFARLARWARHHPTRLASGVSVLLASVVAAIAIAVVYQQGERQTAAALFQVQKERDNVHAEQQKTAAALVLVEKERDRVRDQKDETERQRERAEELGKLVTERYDRAVGAYNVLIKEVDKRFANQIGMEKLRREILEKARDGLQKLTRAGREGRFADRTLVSAYRQLGDVYLRLNDTAEAHKHFALAVEQADRVLDDAEKAPAGPNTAADRRAAALDLGRSLVALAEVLDRQSKSDAAKTAIDRAVQ
ncbi:MAG: protein kinase, partial [Planctomycetes bacterium]|nr:protein kinase [Planctomycetota bacterium]